MRGLGTLVDVVAIAAGVGAGVAVGKRVPDRLRGTLLDAIGLVTVVLGVQDAAKTRNLTFPLVAILIGATIGELVDIERRLEHLGTRLKAMARSSSGTFVDGFVAASLIFCVGPLTILGSISDGLGRGNVDLMVKSALDGTISVVLASTLGIGVIASILPVLVIQGGITLAAGALDAVLTTRMIAELTGTGGVILLGLGIRILELRPIRAANLLPALVVAPVLVGLFAR